MRRERRTARAVQVTTNPGGAAKRKYQRNTAKKESRKRKTSTFAYVLLFVREKRRLTDLVCCRESRGRIKRRRDE